MMIHNDIIRNAFREFRGYEVRSDGDSFMLAFPSVKDACAFSVRVTETLLMVCKHLSYFIGNILMKYFIIDEMEP